MPDKSVIINSSGARRFSVAPMMDWTDRHCRVFHRLMTRRARLYTEMLTTGAILHGDRQRLLGFDPSSAVRIRAISRHPRKSARILATTKSISMLAARRIG
jgi:tRNA-dihydrouridine synthase